MENLRLLKATFQRLSSYRKLEASIIFTFQITIFLVFCVLIPLKEELIHTLSLSENEFITSILVNLIATISGFFAYKAYSKRRNISLTILYELLTIALFMWITVDNFLSLFLFRIITGLIGGAILGRSTEMVSTILGKEVYKPFIQFTLQAYKAYFILAIIIDYVFINSGLPNPLLIFACIIFAISMALLELRSRDKSDYGDGNFIF